MAVLGVVTFISALHSQNNNLYNFYTIHLTNFFLHICQPKLFCVFEFDVMVTYFFIMQDNVTKMVHNFLEYVMNNHHINRESVSILQAFQISLVRIFSCIYIYYPLRPPLLSHILLSDIAYAFLNKIGFLFFCCLFISRLFS